MPFVTVMMYGTSWPRETLHERRRLRDVDRLVEIEVERDVVVEDLARARHEAVVEHQMQVVVRARRAAAQPRAAAETPRASLRSAARSPARRRRSDAGHDGTENAAVVGRRLRRNDCRDVRRDTRRRRRVTLQQIAPAARARGIREVQVELVVAVAERDLALLVRIVEAGRRQRRAADRRDEAHRRARDRRAR